MSTMRIAKVVTRRSKRMGLGYGSGKGGHTTGRGQKGQKARRTINIIFEGYKMKKSLIKRLPKLRGKAKNHPSPFKVDKKVGTIKRAKITK